MLVDLLKSLIVEVNGYKTQLNITEHALMAQWEEQKAHNLLVVGSNPTGRTIVINTDQQCLLLCNV